MKRIEASILLISLAVGSIVVAIHATDSTGAKLQYSITKDPSGLFTLVRVGGVIYVTIANTTNTVEGGQVYILQVGAQNPDNKLTGKIKTTFL